MLYTFSRKTHILRDRTPQSFPIMQFSKKKSIFIARKRFDQNSMPCNSKSISHTINSIEYKIVEISILYKNGNDHFRRGTYRSSTRPPELHGKKKK